MRICLIVYKIDPEKGSEDASGYHIAKAITTAFPGLTLISRQNNIALLKSDPDFQQAELIGIDVPSYLSFYKKKGRGIILYYYLWQKYVARRVKELDKKQAFDVIHQLNFHADWAPHFFNNGHARIVWGPIAHHAFTPASWSPKNVIWSALKEYLKLATKQFFWRANPALRKAIRQSHAIIFANNDVPVPYRKYADMVTFQPYAGSHWPVQPSHSHAGRFHILFVGRFVPLKGVRLVCDAYAAFLDLIPSHSKIKPQLTLIGTGPLEEYVRNRVRHMDGATWQGWISRDQLPSWYQQADFLLYPSLEAQGLVVSEALSQNCAVITLDDTGPAFIAGHPDLTVIADKTDYNLLVKRCAQKLWDLYQLQHDNPARYEALFTAVAQRAETLQWSVIAKNIMKNYSG